MINKLKNSLIELFNPKGAEAEIKLAGPALRIVIGDTHIATLFHDGSSYCLSYEEGFEKIGLPPFNPDELEIIDKPEINKVYKSDFLWAPFASRLPDKKRADYSSALSRHNLNGDEHPLMILGKIGAMSISKPWHIEFESA